MSTKVSYHAVPHSLRDFHARTPPLSVGASIVNRSSSRIYGRFSLNAKVELLVSVVVPRGNTS
jgi:hypothetical protein